MSAIPLNPPVEASVLDFDGPAYLTGPFYIHSNGADVYTSDLLIASWRSDCRSWYFVDLGPNTRALVAPAGGASYVTNMRISGRYAFNSETGYLPTQICGVPAPDMVDAEAHFRSLTPYCPSNPNCMMTSPAQRLRGVDFTNVPTTNYGDRLVIAAPVPIGPAPVLTPAPFVGPPPGAQIAVTPFITNQAQLYTGYYQGKLASTSLAAGACYIWILAVDPALVVGGALPVNSLNFAFVFGPFSYTVLAAQPLLFEVSGKIPGAPNNSGLFLGLSSPNGVDALTTMNGSTAVFAGIASSITRDYAYSSKTRR